MNSVDIITYGAEQLALCAALPDWAEPMKLDVTLPGDVTASLLKSETRRRFATSSRYDFAHQFTTDNAADSHDMRAWLNRLKVETVAAPLWCDEMLLQAACALHATSLNITGSQLAVRYGAEWLIMNDDGSQYEIVVVTGLTSTTITLSSPGTANAWPAGTAIYPLMFGRLAERPMLTSRTDEDFTGTLKFHESSPFARKSNTRAIAPSLMGAHGGEFSLYKLWTMEPDWVEPRDWTESDVTIKAIPENVAREEQKYQYQNWNRRGLEMQFTCRTRDEIAAIEYFFNDRKGTNLPFFIPTFRGDVRLAENVALGDDTFEIEPSRYEIAAYDEIPGSGVLCFIDDNGVFPQRITEVSGTTITPIIAVGEAHTAASTVVSFCMLVRFLEEKLTWQYTSDGLAKTRLKFIELPSEYVTPAPAVSPPAKLYKWEEGLPNGTTNTWYFTSYEEQISFGGHVYTPAPFTHGTIHKDLKLDDNVEITSWGGDFIGNPLGRFLPYTLNAALFCTITRVNRDAPDDGSARQLFYGRVKAPIQMTGPDWKATLRDSIDRLLDVKFPRMLFQPVDNWIQFEAPTQLNAADFDVAGTLKPQGGGSGAPTGSMIIWLIGATNASDYFAGGWLETGVGGNFEQRSIYDSVFIGPNIQELTLDRPLIKAIASQAATIYPGYDGSIDQCETRYNNRKRHGGHAFMPDQNQVFQTGEMQTPTGGKKG